MKMIVIFFLIAVSQVTASVYGQNVSLEGYNLSLLQVFREIKKQTGYTVICNAEIVKEINNIDLSIKDKPLKESLSLLLSKYNLSYEILKTSIIIQRDLLMKNNMVKSDFVEQERRIYGQVSTTSNLKLVGASVSVNNSKVETKTDSEGRFEILAKENDILTFSYVGYKFKQYKIGASNNLIIQLEEIQEALEEVLISVGYGQQIKKHITGSVAQVSSEELTKVPLPNITQALVGKLPGVVFKQNSGQPGQDNASMLVRGYGTYNDSSPLILVDGVERSFSHIDPNDIASVSVLKDAAAAAVYGVKGAHGVILVTTKRGNTNKPTLNYNGSLSVSENTMFPDFLTGTEYATWHNKANEMDGNRKWFTDEQIAMMSNGDPSDGLENTDWVNKFLGQSAPTTQHSLSVSGGSEKSRYFTSIGMMDQNGFVKNLDFKRYNIRTNLDLTINDSWSASVNLAGRLEESNTPGALSFAKQATWNPVAQAFAMLPFLPYEYKGLPIGSTGMTFNPFAAVELSGFQKGASSIIETSGELVYRPVAIKGLKVSMFGSYDRRYTDSKSFSTPYTVYAYEPQTAKYTKTLAAGFLSDGSLIQSAGNSEFMLARPSIEYKREFGKHDVTGLLLYEIQKGLGSSMSASRWGYVLTELPELSFGQVFPAASNSGRSNESVRAGLVGRANYAYDSKYLVELSFRRDGSYKFPAHSRWGFFPSASIGWIVSEENFFKDFSAAAVDQLKFRASAGILGRDNVAEFLYRQNFALSGQPIVAFGSALTPLFGLSSTSSYPSVDLTWEKTKVYNVGLELSMWNGQLGLELDGFYKYTYDILQNVGSTYPSSLGGNYPTIENTGSVDVRGLELQLSHRKNLGDFGYTISGNISYAKNRILSLIQAENINPWQSMIGKSIGQRMTFVAKGLMQTEEQLQNTPWFTTGDYKRLGDIYYEDINGDGKIDYNSDQIVGTRPEMPELMYALNFDFKYKNFDFSMMWQGAALNDVLLTGVYDNGVPDGTIFTKPFYGVGNNTARYILEESWTLENTNARYPRLSLVVSGPNSTNSTWWIGNGAFVRLRNASFGYNIPKEVLEKVKIKGLRVYVAGANLLTFSGLKYLDPEMPSVNNGYYPQQRTISGGLSLTF